MFKSFEEFINESIPKKKWVDLPKPVEYSLELINLVQKAYKKTDKGSFVNTAKDVDRSKWLSIDYDDYPDIDATIFYREARKDETWKGKKIQGIGHDNSKEGIQYVLGKLKEVLQQDGVWVEASDALEHVLYKMKVPYIKDSNLIEGIFPKGEVEFLNNKGKYQRKLATGELVTESIFGKPKLKK